MATLLEPYTGTTLPTNPSKSDVLGTNNNNNSNNTSGNTSSNTDSGFLDSIKDIDTNLLLIIGGSILALLLLFK